jgi:hypothetical protein
MGIYKDKLLIHTELPEQLGSSGNAYITYPEGAWFESRSEHQLSRLRVFRGYPLCPLHTVRRTATVDNTPSLSYKHQNKGRQSSAESVAEKG